MNDTQPPSPVEQPPLPKPHLNAQHLRQQLQAMVRIRRFEERCAELYSEEKIRGFLHLYIGEEAVAVGVNPALRAEDAVIATYREHGHALARGISMDAVMAEMYGKVGGCSHGRGGSMHLFDAAHRFFGGNAIVAGGLPLAVGLALADKLQHRQRITACFFGEGAVAEGEFHESLNLAALWQLPVLFICENNLYAMGTALQRSESEQQIYRKAASYGLLARAVDGMNVVEVEDAAQRACAAIRQGQGPQFLECRTYRFRGHSMFDTQLYRDKQEIEQWQQRGPIVQLTAWLQQSHQLTDAELEALYRHVDAEVEAAVEFAEQSALEPEQTLCQDVYTPSAAAGKVQRQSVDAATPEQTPGPDLSYREAVRAAISEALENDPRVFLMGEDVGRYGGCYAVTKGLIQTFGEERIRDTPLSESAFVGAGVGAALGDMRPIVEVMTVNFSLLALDQIVNNAATIRHMSGGQFSVPLVVRMATGAGRQLAAQHSHSLECWYAHVPGLKVLAPATAEDARYMLAQALEDPDPVIIFEHVMLYNLSGAINPDGPSLTMEQASIRRPGDAVTLIGYGGTVDKCLDAAERLAERGISAEVLDLRCLRPLDRPALVRSVTKTHRAVVVDEGWRSGSLAAEISALLMEQAFWELDAPVARVCTQEVPIPYPQHLEQAALPQIAEIMAAAEATLARQ